MRENTGQKNSEYGLFSRSVYSGKYLKTYIKTPEIIPFLVNLQVKTVNLLKKEAIARLPFFFRITVSNSLEQLRLTTSHYKEKIIILYCYRIIILSYYIAYCWKLIL